MSVSATERLSRLLALVPWLQQRQGVSIEEAARHFGVTREQVIKDLELIFLCGLPGHLPDDLIEAEWDSGRVYLSNAEVIAEPLRLTMSEAIPLLAGLRTLSQVPGVHARASLDSAMAKLSAAAGEAATAHPLAVELGGSVAPEVDERLREALKASHRIQLVYLVPSRDESTQRDVDPMQIFHSGGHWYLEGWCHRAEAVRLFRFDRIQSVTDLGVDGTPPAEARARDVDEAIFTPAQGATQVVLEVAPSARWVADYYPVHDVAELPDGGLQIQLWVTDPEWIRALVLSLGGQAQLVAPEQLREGVRQAAAGALEAYAAQRPPFA